MHFPGIMAHFVKVGFIIFIAGGETEAVQSSKVPGPELEPG